MLAALLICATATQANVALPPELRSLSLRRVDIVVDDQPIQTAVSELFRQVETMPPVFEKDFPESKVSARNLNLPLLEALSLVLKEVGGRFDLDPTSRGRLRISIDPILAKICEPEGKKQNLVKDLLQPNQIPFAFPAGLEKSAVWTSKSAPIGAAIWASLRAEGFWYRMHGRTVVAEPIRRPVEDVRDLVLVFKAQDRSLLEVLSRLARSVGVTIAVDSSVNTNQKVDLVSSGTTWEQLLQTTLKQVSLTYRVIDHGVYQVIERTH